MPSPASGDQYSDMARQMSQQPGVLPTLEYATRTAQKVLPGCDHASIAVVLCAGRVIESVAPTDDWAAQADQLQHDQGDGPCLQAIHEQETVYCGDLRTEDRWPKWASAVSQSLDIRSSLSLQLFVGAKAIGSLNMYSRMAHAFPADARADALAFASHLAVAMDAAQSHEHMEAALLNRLVIGQAQGILMNALDLTAEQAFAALKRLSQAQNKKLHRVADDLVVNGIQPDLFG
jgi:transcriptional regulator with GAF, ATPase, and Fis domain